MVEKEEREREGRGKERNWGERLGYWFCSWNKTFTLDMILVHVLILVLTLWYSLPSFLPFSFFLGFTTIDDSCFPLNQKFLGGVTTHKQRASEWETLFLPHSFFLTLFFVFLSIWTFLSLSFTGKKFYDFVHTRIHPCGKRYIERNEKEERETGRTRERKRKETQRNEKNIQKERKKCQTRPHPFMWKLVTREKRLSWVRKTHFHFFFLRSFFWFTSHIQVCV